MIVFHIGARGNPIKEWEIVGDQIDLVGFEPYEQACKDLNNLPKVLKSQTFYPIAISGKTGERDFYKVSTPRNSSLLEPNLDVWKSWNNWERAKVQSVEKIETTSLNDFCKEHGIYPDFIKLDTQGTELEILKNFNNLLNLFGIETEVLHKRLYKECPLFPRTDRFLKSRGFKSEILNTVYWEKYKIFSDVLYIKNWNSILYKKYRKGLHDKRNYNFST